jgi:hypothetical protein
MNKSASVSKFNFFHFTLKCWILLKPVLGGHGRWLANTITWLNQTEPVTFSILPWWAFFRDSVFVFFFFSVKTTWCMSTCLFWFVCMCYDIYWIQYGPRRSLILQGFFQDFGNMTYTHGFWDFKRCFVKNWGQMHDLNFAVIKWMQRITV